MKRTIAVVLAAMSLSVSGSAYATSTNLVVSAEVRTLRTCSISTSGNLDFGTYDPHSGAMLDGTGSVVVNCTPGTDYTLTPNWGGYGMPGNRLMSGPMALVNYQLYTDSGRSSVWGQGFNIVGGTGNGSDQVFSVYGKFFGFGPVANGSMDGSYTDNVAMVVDYTP